MAVLTGAFEWLGGAVNSAGSAPSVLCQVYLNASRVRFRGVDLSKVTGTLIQCDADTPIRISLEQCKLAAGVTLATGTIAGPHGNRVLLDNCDSADTNYRMQRRQYEGDVYH